MERTNKKRPLRFYLKWVAWVLLVQFLLINISAALYAYKFSHFYADEPPAASGQNIFGRTWKIFVGPKFYKVEDEPEPPFPYKTIVLKTGEGLSIDCWYATVDKPLGCVVFFHGITANKTSLSKEAAQFRDWGYNVLMVDFRGHGRSGGTTTSFGNRETEEVKLAFRFARSNGNQNIILFGSSLGAVVCLKAAAEKKVEPSAIIAQMPFASLRHHFKARAKEVGFPKEPFASLVTFWAGVQRGFNGFGLDAVDDAAKISAPVLIEWGRKDHLVNESEINGIFSKLASSNKRLVVYDHAGHESFFKAAHEKWKAETLSFLTALN